MQAEIENSQKEWHPGTSPKQDDLRELCKRKKFVLASGPRFSTKTIGCLHAFLDHAFNTPRGNACMVTISQTVGFDSGIWKDLTDIVIPQWIKGNFGLEYHREPYLMGVSKKPTCEIVNRIGCDMEPKERKANGGITVIQLESLKVEEEVEDRFKPRRYSTIYVPELSTFRKLKTFLTWTETLRLIGLPSDKHLFLADTNPSDEGIESWIYKLWYELLDMDDDSVPIELSAIKSNLARIEFEIADNIFDTPERIAELVSKYSLDEDLYARYIKGEWVTASEDALFSKLFRPSTHVRGEIGTSANSDPEILVPEENCHELYTGWDPGSSNSAVVFAEKAFTQVENRTLGVLKFLDEVVVTGEPHTLEELVMAVLKKMAFWEDVCGRPGRIAWRHWSDRNVFDAHSPESSRFYHQIIFDESVLAMQRGDVKVTAPIVLEAAPKGPGSVAHRVDLWRKFLFDERIYFSADKCPKLIQMNKSLKRGTTQMQVIAKASRWKHVFDAASYLASSEFSEDLTRACIVNMVKVRKHNASRLITIDL